VQLAHYEGATMIITGRQLRAACALAGLHQKSLAELSGVSVQTIQYMESFEDTMVGCRPLTLEKVDLPNKKVVAGGGDFWAINPKGYVPALLLLGVTWAASRARVVA